MELAKTGKVDKEWGYEIVWASNGFYCGKILVFERAGAKTTLVISKNKKKSWFVQAGKFKIEFIDIKTGVPQTATLEEGKTVDIAEMSPHSIESLAPGSMIFEVGTPEDLADQFRLSPDDALQTSSVELK